MTELSQTSTQYNQCLDDTSVNGRIWWFADGQETRRTVVKWEYKFVELYHRRVEEPTGKTGLFGSTEMQIVEKCVGRLDEEWLERAELLGKLGEEGWELVTAQLDRSSYDKVFMYFKQPKS